MMKVAQSNSEKFIWDSVRSPSGAPIAVSASQSKPFPKLMVWLILFVSATYMVYTMKLLSSSHHSCGADNFPSRHFPFQELENGAVPSPLNPKKPLQFSSLKQEFQEERKTGLEHIVFGIAASAKLWQKRKQYIKLWWKPEERRDCFWLDRRVKTYKNETGSLPELRISGDTSKFRYTNKQGHRSAIRISRIVSETLRLGGMDNVRWFVMGDDDTVFVTDNLDRCIQRYPGLYGSDDRMQACMAELGVPLTKELGFHQQNGVSHMNQTVSKYTQHRDPHPACKWKMADPADIDRVEVYKKPDPHLWDRAPRRNCCRVISSKKRSLVIDVGVCEEGEVSEV
ncbi:UNVERIFIED_CONTAM: hypothetical protein Sradi_6811900 [Sesamum radiatum]|uniref:Uncharacterized protein n=1 Tax=Sesamum radiatum TaxID=300843 RepID=A0AAW2JU17_SESRA